MSSLVGGTTTAVFGEAPRRPVWVSWPSCRSLGLRCHAPGRLHGAGALFGFSASLSSASDYSVLYDPREVLVGQFFGSCGKLCDADAKATGQADNVAPAGITPAVLDLAQPALRELRRSGERDLADLPLIADRLHGGTERWLIGGRHRLKHVRRDGTIYCGALWLKHQLLQTVARIVDWAVGDDGSCDVQLTARGRILPVYGSGVADHRRNRIRRRSGVRVVGLGMANPSRASCRRETRTSS